MRGILNLMRKYPKLLCFGALTSMLSGPGQTFLVSLFIPHIQEFLSLSKTGVSGIYSAATLLSGCVLPFVGHGLDRIPLRVVTLLSATLLLIGCLTLGAASNILMVFVGFFLVRNLGQGAMMIISSTTMARHFGSLRGKALGIANLGYPLSEAFFPSVVTLCILQLGWRQAWLVLAAVIAFVFIPIIIYLLQGEESTPVIGMDTASAKSQTPHDNKYQWKINEVLRDWRFYVLLLPSSIPPFFMTALFFHQLSLGATKGWDAPLLAAGFISFAICRAPVSLLIGPVVDKYTATRLYPLNLLPMTLALFSFWLGDGWPWVFVYLSLLGVGMGFGMTISSAFWAEMYGTKYLGSIRGLMSAIMVFSTALAPLLMGVLLDANYSLDGIMVGMILICLAGTFFASMICYFFGSHRMDSTSDLSNTSTLP